MNLAFLYVIAGNPTSFTSVDENEQNEPNKSTDEAGEDELNDEATDDEIPLVEDFKIGDSGTWYQFGLSMKDKAKNMLQKDGIGKTINALRSEILQKKLLKDLKLFPVWGNVYQKKFGYGKVPATSASSESEFNKFKNGLLRKGKKSRPDELIHCHLQYLYGRTKIDSAALMSNTTSDLREEVSLAEFVL